MGRQSLGFVLLALVLGIGVILLIPHVIGKIPKWRQELDIQSLANECVFVVVIKEFYFHYAMKLTLYLLSL